MNILPIIAIIPFSIKLNPSAEKIKIDLHVGAKNINKTILFIAKTALMKIFGGGMLIIVESIFTIL